MLEQLLGLIQDHSQDAIVQNPAVPNIHNEAAQSTILDSIMGGLQSQVQGNNLGGLMGLLAGKAGTGSNLMSNPIVAGIATNAVSSLMDKFGIHNQAAQSIVSSVLPSVLGSLINKTNDPNDSSIDMNGVMGSLLGGSGSQLSQQTQGFDFNQIGAALSDGKIDMNDIMNIGGSLLGGGGSSSQGGLGGLLGGLFGGNK
ncbi:MAG: DUF937 domain-containing protein [Spirosomataceae bacterium]